MSFVQNTAGKAKAWGQSLFTIDPNATPEQIERKRQLIAAMMPRGDAKYVGSGLADLAKGVALGVKGRRMDKFEGEKRKEASDAFRSALGQVPAPQGPLSILGMNPEWGAEQSFVQQPEAAPQQMPVNPSPDVTGAFAGAAGGLPGSLIRTESGGNLRALNDEGYGGRGQFGTERLADAARAGVIPPGMTGAEYSQQPAAVQLAVENWHKADILRNVGQYVGVDVDGAGPIPPLTENSLLAVAHLGGTGGAKKFVESGGRYNPSDSNGTSLADYATTHAGGPAGAAGGPAPAGFGGLSVPQYSGPPIADLQAALMNPWLSAGEKQMAATMLDRAMQQGDPAYQLGLQKQQLEIAKLSQPERADPIEIGGVLLDPETYQPIFDTRGTEREALMNAGDGQIYDPNTGEWITAPNGKAGFREATAEEAGKYGAAAGQFGPDGRFYPINPPSGFLLETGPDGQMRVSQGAGAGSAAGKPFTEGQSKDNVFATRAEGALAALDPVAGKLTDRGDILAETVPFGLARGTQSDDFQLARQAGDEFLQAILRKDTGAAITEQEQALYGKTYLPSPGDSEAVIGQKAQARRRALEALKAGMSPAQMVAQERALQASGSKTVEPVQPASRRRYNPQTGEFE